MKEQIAELKAPPNTQTLVLLGVTGGGIYLCYLLAAPFLAALVWALVLAVIFNPLQNWFDAKLKHPNLATTASVLVIILMVVLPASFVVQNLVRQAANGAEIIQSKVNNGEWRRDLAAQPQLAPLAERIEREIDLPGTTKSLAIWFSARAGSIVAGSVSQLLEFCLILYLLYFFLRDRKVALQSLRALCPLSETEMDGMLGRISDTIYATIYGTLAVATVQGVLGGLMFWWLDLPAPLLWGVVMGLLAVVPVLGAFIVWIPAALFLVLAGHWGQALILSLWGLIGIGTIDNFLYPVFVGKRLKLHTVPAFLAVVGGLLLFGAAGLILGPLALTITLVLLEIWSARNKAATLPLFVPLLSLTQMPNNQASESGV